MVYSWQEPFTDQPGNGLFHQEAIIPVHRTEGAIKMVRSKPRVKKEKQAETTEEFVARINAEARKRNGLKQNLKRARR